MFSIGALTLRPLDYGSRISPGGACHGEGDKADGGRFRVMGVDESDSWWIRER